MGGDRAFYVSSSTTCHNPTGSQLSDAKEPPPPDEDVIHSLGWVHGVWVTALAVKYELLVYKTLDSRL
jgi:hypothetical protein